MATYKKRGYKPKDKQEQQMVDEAQSATAEVFNTLDETANKSEQWIEKNSKPLFYALVAIVVVVLGFLGYNKFVVEPNETEASNELAFPRKYFDEALAAGSESDSLYSLSLEGADGNYGFVDIADAYGSTKAGNLAKYYAGISYKNLKKYDKAIEYLSSFSSDDEILGPTALGAIGDIFADINQQNDALEYYQKAADKKNNEFTTPLFLFKAGETAMQLKDYATAEKLFERIKKDFSKSQQGVNIEKYIYSAKYAQ